MRSEEKAVRSDFAVWTDARQRQAGRQRPGL